MIAIILQYKIKYDPYKIGQKNENLKT